MGTTVVLAVLLLAAAAPARCALKQISGSDCVIAGDQCIAKDGKYYIEQAMPCAGLECKEVGDNDVLWATAKAGGWTPTAANLGLFNPATMKVYPGTSALFAKYNLNGYCQSSVRGADMDCYVSDAAVARDVLKKFAYIKDPVKRADTAIQDRLLFDAWLKSQPSYACHWQGGGGRAEMRGLLVYTGG